jgi:hypothetical protein
VLPQIAQVTPNASHGAVPRAGGEAPLTWDARCGGQSGGAYGLPCSQTSRGRSVPPHPDPLARARRAR